MSIGRPEAHEILELRRQLGMTQEELARRLGTTVVQIDQWEHGYSQPGAAERARLPEHTTDQTKPAQRPDATSGTE